MALRSPPFFFLAQAPVAGGNSVCVKGIGYQHDSSQVSLDRLAEEVPSTFLPHKALIFLLCMLVSLHTLRSMNGVSFLPEGSHHMSFLELWGELCLLTCFIVPVIIWCLHIFNAFLLSSAVGFQAHFVCFLLSP